ncbi:hypothetical protein GACE_1541 [Geoglobus acetivorans]|uniref:Uncharacterized protein n=1 Tax=Geoglobus acetivorans TaxID=565033 RepID=A0A0A7GI19_GEOAI|nr:hypothetical protein GACE_1541 [Geoglobus acetivorans]
MRDTYHREGLDVIHIQQGDIVLIEIKDDELIIHKKDHYG